MRYHSLYMQLNNHSIIYLSHDCAFHSLKNSLQRKIFKLLLLPQTKSKVNISLGTQYDL